MSKSLATTLIALLGLIFKFGAAHRNAVAAPVPKPASTSTSNQDAEEQAVYPIREEEMPDELRSLMDDLVN